MENQKVRDLSTAQNPKTTDFVMLITNLTNNVLEKCQISALKDLLTTNNISEDEENILTTGSDDKLYVPSSAEDISNLETEISDLRAEINELTNTLNQFRNSSEVIEEHIATEGEGTKGWRIYKNGYCEQWGNATTTTNAVGTGIFFEKEFKGTLTTSNSYSVIGTLVGDLAGGSAINCTLYINKMTGRNFIAKAKNTSGSVVAVNFNWRAFGYLKSGEY